MLPKFSRFLLMVGVACWMPYASAQSLAGLGAISGTVRDATDSAVVDAQVTVSNSSNGITRKLTTNESGYFIAPSLPPGPGYSVSVSKSGFASFEAKEVQVQVGQNVTLTLKLDVAQQVQTVTVADSTPIVEQSKTGVSQVVDGNQILNLPINGRRVDSFVLLSPGVTNDGTFGAVSFRGMPAGNAFLQDGNDTTLQFYNENAGRTRISSNISQDSVQEFQVQASGFSAEFGRAVGGVINTVTKSGTNDVHGTGYWFFRNRTLNARDRYAAFNPPEYRHQAGGSIGGPIKKDKLFYFFNYDATRRNFPLLSSILNSQFFNAGGDFIGTCAAPATPTQCANAVTYFRRFFGTVERKVTQDLYFGKLDWRPNDYNSISASFNLLNWESPNGIQTAAALTNAGAIGNNGLSTVRTRWARLAHTGIFSTSMVNEARFGWYKDRLADETNYDLAPPGVRSAVTVQGQSNLGVPNYLPRVQPTEDRFQFADNLSWTKDRHQFKFGFDIAHTKDIEDALFNGVGSYTYGTIGDFAQDLTNLDGGKRWQSYSQAFGAFKTEVSVQDYNFYAQDQWRITDKLTINYGLRYEYAKFRQPTQFNPDYPQTAQINEPGKNFSPRFGVAYSPSAKTVFRAGYGIFYARFPSATIARLHQLNGVVQKSITLQSSATDRALGPVFPNRLTGIDRNPPAGTVTIAFADPNLATPYTQQADISIERELTRNMGITVSYLWNRALKSMSRRDLNYRAPSGTFTYRINNAAGQQVGSYTTPTYTVNDRIDSRYQRVILIDNGGRVWYDGLAVQFRRRASKWLDGTIAYTWSHSRDLNQGGASNNVFFTDGPATLWNGDYNAEKGTSTLDLRHRFVGTALITPPRHDFGNGVANQVLNGWQLSFLVTSTATNYATPSITVSGNQFTNPNPAFNNTLNGFGGSSQVPFLARQSVPIDSIQRTDSRLTKEFTMRERVRLHLNFEVFNLFNRVSNTSVITTAYRAQSGVLIPDAGLGTGTASGGFPDGTNARRAQVSMRVIF